MVHICYETGLGRICGVVIDKEPEEVSLREFLDSVDKYVEEGDLCPDCCLKLREIMKLKQDTISKKIDSNDPDDNYKVLSTAVKKCEQVIEKLEGIST